MNILATRAGKTLPGRMDNLESMAAESSPLSPELRNRNKRKETTHYQRASLRRYTQHTHTHNLGNHLTFAYFLGVFFFMAGPITVDVDLSYHIDLSHQIFSVFFVPC